MVTINDNCEKGISIANTFFKHKHIYKKI